MFDCDCFVLFQANLAVQEGRLRVANNELAKAEAQLAEKQAEFEVVQAKCDAAIKEKQVGFGRPKTEICVKMQTAAVYHWKRVFSGLVR